MIRFKWVCNSQNVWKTYPYRFKTKICFRCTFIYYMQVLSVPLLCNEGIVNIQALCSIPLAWTWRYCQWYWQCLHIQTIKRNTDHLHKSLPSFGINAFVPGESLKIGRVYFNFKGAWCIYFYFISYRNTCTCMQRVKILIIRRILRRLIWACTVCLYPFLQDTMHK